MKKTYDIEIDCANCANLCEQKIKTLDGVESASVNFFAQKMVVEFKDGADDKKVLKEIVKAAKKIEPDFEIV